MQRRRDRPERLKDLILAPFHLHREFGLNPAIPLCFYCGEEKREIILAGAACRGEAPRNAVWDLQPCDNCEALMQRGIIMIGVESEAEFDKIEKARIAHEGEHCRKPPERRPPFIPGPYRSGHWLVVSDDLVRRIVSPPELAQQILRVRWTFAQKEICQRILDEQKLLQESSQTHERSDSFKDGTPDVQGRSQAADGCDPAAGGNAGEGNPGVRDELHRRQGEDV